MNKKNNDGNETIKDNEALFKAQGNYGKEGHLTTGTVNDHFRDINNKLGGEKSKNGIYGKFVIKNLRTLFKSTCKEALQYVSVNAEKTVYLNVLDLFLGHKERSAVAYAYETLPEDSPNSYLRLVYEQLIDVLSIRDTEVKAFKSEEYKKMETKLEEKDKEIKELKQIISETQEQVKETKETLNLITKEKTYNSIYKTINDYVMDNIFYDNPNEEELVIVLATDYAVEHKDDFDYSEDYIKKILRRVQFQIEMDGRPIKNQLNSYFGTSDTSIELQSNIQLVLDKIWESEKMMETFFNSKDSMAPEDLVKLEDLIENELSKYDEDLSDEDVNNIILDVAMQY